MDTGEPQSLSFATIEVVLSMMFAKLNNILWVVSFRRPLWIVGGFGLAIWLSLGPAGSAVQTGSSEVAVVVGRENNASDLSFYELVRIFKQERQFWGDGKKIFLLLRAPDDAEQTVLLRKVYRMEQTRLRQFWLGKLYQGEIINLPRALDSDEAVKRFVSRMPNAIGVIGAAAADPSVKVLRIDGKAPGDVGYPLAADF